MKNTAGPSADPENDGLTHLLLDIASFAPLFNLDGIPLKKMEAIPFDKLRTGFRHKVFKMLLARGKITEEMIGKSP
jgi:hypothetical protein